VSYDEIEYGRWESAPHRRQCCALCARPVQRFVTVKRSLTSDPEGMTCTDVCIECVSCLAHAAMNPDQPVVRHEDDEPEDA
jgi:hypothetical protein